jgi:hypothetical protein
VLHNIVTMRKEKSSGLRITNPRMAVFNWPGDDLLGLAMKRREPRRVATQQDIEDAVGILDYLLHDIVLAHQLYDFFVNMVVVRGIAEPETEQGARRMYVSYLLLTLQKFAEFWDRYKWLASEEIKARCERIVRELRRRGIVGLRHTFISHVVNDKTGRPISAAELESGFRAAIDNDLDAFLRWIHIGGNAVSPETIVGIISGLHKELRARLQ